MVSPTDEEVLVELDDRRRVYLAKVGNSAHKRYLVRTEPDGTMIFTPASIVPSHVLRLLDHPEVLAAVRDARDHPEQLVQRKLRQAPEVDWETP